MMQQQPMYVQQPLTGSTVVVMGGPTAQVMDPVNQDGSAGYNVMRRTKLCFACFPCCVPNMEWDISEYRGEVQPGQQPPTLLSAIEDSPFCCRFCCHMGARQSTYRVFNGHVTPESAASQQPVLTFQKSLTCHRHAPFCCFPYYQVFDQSGADLGTAKYVCCPCVPTMQLEVPTGVPKYRIQPETCLFCCVRPRCGGAGARCCRVQYLVRDMANNPVSDAMITQLWSGAINELFLNKTQYSCKYPPSSDRGTRATLLAANLLMDMAMNEKDDQQQ